MLAVRKAGVSALEYCAGTGDTPRSPAYATARRGRC